MPRFLHSPTSSLWTVRTDINIILGQIFTLHTHGFCVFTNGAQTERFGSLQLLKRDPELAIHSMVYQDLESNKWTESGFRRMRWWEDVKGT
jgi:hypothetical protein